MAKIIIKNIYYMLSYAYQGLRETGYASVAAEDFEHIHDLFAAILIHGVSRQIKSGLHREYISKKDMLSGLRGKIQISESVRQQAHTKKKLVCLYDEFTEDSLHNQVLKSTMLLLLRRGNVRRENKQAIRKLLSYFSDITDLPPQSIRWDSLKYHKNNASYRMLMNICRLVIKGLLQTTEVGDHRLSSWLQDEEMHRLYERFVLSYYKRHHPDYSPHAGSVDWDIAEGMDKSGLPNMITDITLSKGEKRLIIDTKYYSHTMQTNSLYNSSTFISGNLYQIFAYVKNSDKEASGNVAGVLLYAKTDEDITPDKDFVIGGNRISLKTLDLNRDWNEITEQLEALCIWLEDLEHLDRSMKDATYY